MLPKMNGFDVVRTLRSKKVSTPVILLTARDEVTDKVKGLDCGADDYLTKPFSTEELLARIRAVSRRLGEVLLDELQFADLTLNLSNCTLSCKTKSIKLGYKEFEIMKLLMANPGAIISKDDRPVKQVDVRRHQRRTGKAVRVDGVGMVLRGNFDSAGLQVADGMVPAAVAEFQLISPRAVGQRKDRSAKTAASAAKARRFPISRYAMISTPISFCANVRKTMLLRPAGISFSASVGREAKKQTSCATTLPFPSCLKIKQNGHAAAGRFWICSRPDSNSGSCTRGPNAA